MKSMISAKEIKRIMSKSKKQSTEVNLVLKITLRYGTKEEGERAEDALKKTSTLFQVIQIVRSLPGSEIETTGY